jgi:hypothetical protein
MVEAGDLLSEALNRVVPRGFFSPLARPERAGFFIDCIDRLERESSAQAGELGRREALQLISETLTEHSDIDWAQDTDTSLADTRASFAMVDAPPGLVAVVLGFVGAFDRHAEIFGLLFR